MLIAPDMLEHLFEQAPHATFVLTPELTLLAANAAARRLIGEERLVAGLPLLALMPPPSPSNGQWQARLRQSYADLLASRKPVSLLLPARNGIAADGRALAGAPDAAASSIWHICHAPVLDQSGALVAIATHAHALAGVEVAIAQVSGFATTQMATTQMATAPAVSGVAADAESGVAVDAATAATGATTATAATGATGESPRAASDLLHVLLVEDSDDLRLATVEQLKFLGHQVTGVADAEQAMRLLDAGRFDLLFTDLTLPKMTGAELARVVLNREQPMQVVITSGYGRALANAQSLDALFLPKPYRFEDLQVVLQQVHVRRLRALD